MYVRGQTENSICKKMDELADQIWKKIEVGMNVM